MARANARVLAVVQARMTSSRLPGKVLEDLGGVRVLELLLQRLRQAEELQGIVVATSGEASDDAVAEVAAALDVPVVRGPLHDVLERYRLTVIAHPCEAVVRITADCPLVDPDVVDLVVRRWRAGGEDYVANIIEPRTFPKGLDTEVVSTAALGAAATAATEPYDREHVTPYVRSRPERFPQARVAHEPPYEAVRLTLDTPEDLDALRELLERTGVDVRMSGLIAALGATPDHPDHRRRRGLRAIEQPLVYRLWQAPFAERKFAPILRHNDLSRVAHVLDVGCGPGTNTHHFPATGYLGLDINPAYIDYARRHHERDFVVADVADYIPADGTRPDFVFVNSFLHHVDDEDVQKILSRLAELTAPEGQLHVLELVLPQRPSLARLLARLDRGDYARPLERWRQLFSEHFEPLIFEPYRLGVAGAAFWNMVYFKGRPLRSG